jgi:hypothetical protein
MNLGRPVREIGHGDAVVTADFGPIEGRDELGDGLWPGALGGRGFGRQCGFGTAV